MTIEISKSKGIILGTLVGFLILSMYKDGVYLVKGASILGVTINDTKGDSDTMVTLNNISDIDSDTIKNTPRKVTTTKIVTSSPHPSSGYSSQETIHINSLSPTQSITSTPNSTPSPYPTLSKTPSPTFSKTPTPTTTKTPTPSPTLPPVPTQTPSPSFSPLSVVINEIAWMGTNSSYTDEWIELYNNTGNTIDLQGWILKSLTDDSPNIVLTGTISAHGYYVIERTNDSVIANVSANLISSFGKGGLNNSGEVLVLLDSSGTEQDRVGTDGASWAAGDNVTKSTMARIDSMSSGYSYNNWATHNSGSGSEIDASEGPIAGSPGRANQTP